jgi:transmembrane sensor
MDRYQKFTLEKFVWDEPFRNWVLRPTREDDLRWQEWLAANPEKQNIVTRARELVKAIGADYIFLPQVEKREAIRKIILELSTHNSEEPEPTARSPFIRRWLGIAATVMLLSVLGLGLLNRRTKNVDYDQLVSAASEPLTERKNGTSDTLLIKLEDGSMIKLCPNSKISFPGHFAVEKREVYLSGEAFFDIAKNPSSPFFVYTNEVVTKVLGTSFFVRSYKNEKEISVSVRTGRVAVFTRSDPTIHDKLTARELAGVVIEPNQQIVLVRESVKITKSLISEPELIEKNTTDQSFDFDEIPVTQVFSTLQKAYGIEIIYDKNVMNQCPITATLTDLTLYEKLDLVCKAVGASYEIIDGRILIEGRGCK